MSHETFKTPEGFDLYKPLIFPDVNDLADLFTVERPWDFATMNHRNGYPQPDTPKDLIPSDFLSNPKITNFGSARPVGRFLSVRNLPGRYHMQVTATPMLLEKIWQSETLKGFGPFSFFDRVGFEAIYHESNDRVLVVASASGIIASRWLAYVDPATVPTLAEIGVQ